jgi:hypothetical protein
MPNISRTKTWASNETLTASDLNAEFNGILTGINDNALDADNLTLSDAYAWTGLHTFNNANTVLGHTAALTTNAANQLQVLGTADADSSLLVGRFSADASGGQINFAKSRDGTIGDKGAVADNDVLGGIYFYGCDVTGSSGDFATPGASVLARVNGTPGANDLPTELVFSTTADAANSTTERLRISQAGLVEVVGDLSVGDDVTLGSDSAVLSMGAGNDVTLTHDGTTGVTIAATPITVDSGGNLTLDAHTGIHIFKDAGTEVLRFTEGNSGDVTIKLATNGKDLVFTDNGDATNLKVLDAAAGINVPGEVQTTKIAYTDGDDAITIADGGGVTTASTLAIGSVAAAGSDVDKFLVLDGSGNVDYRTGTEVASDIGAQTSATAADDIATGDAAVSLVTTSGNITIDAQANDADVIIKVDDGGSAVTAVTFDGSDEGNAIFVNDVQLKSDSAVLEFGADLDTSLTHTDGTGLTLNSTNKLTFGDAASFIQQSADGTLRIDGEAIIDLNASTRVDVSGALAVGSTITSAAITATDTTAPLILKYDAQEYVTHAVSSAGVYSIATTDDSSDSGAITLDTVDSITLDSDTATEGIVYADGGTGLLRMSNSSSDVIIKPLVDAKDIIFQQYDGTEVVRVTDAKGLGTASGTALKLSSNGVAWEFPTADGSADQYLKTDGSGNLDWASAGSGGVDAANGASDRIATFTDSDSLNGEANLTFDGSTLAVSGVASLADGSVSAPSLTNTGDTNQGLYFPGTDIMGVTTAGEERMRFGSDGTVYIGNDIPSNNEMGDGLIIKTNTDQNALALYDDEVAHGFTSQNSETDMYGHFRKTSDTIGGLRIRGFMEDTNAQHAMIFQSFGGQADTTKSTGGNGGLICFQAYEHDGSGSYADTTADGVVFSLATRRGGSGFSIFMIDEDGDIFYDGSAASMDTFDDAQLIRCMSLETTKDPKSLVRSRWDHLVKYKKDDLVSAGLLGAVSPEDEAKGHTGLVNACQMQRLFMGAHWQAYEDRAEMRETIESLQGRLTEAETTIKRLT